MLSGIRKISIFDPATGITVQVNQVVPEGELMIAKPLSLEDSDGEYFYDGDESYFEFGIYDNSNAYDQLKKWMDAGTPIQIVATGLEQNLLWYESVPLLIERKFIMKAGNRNFYICRVAKKRGTHSINVYSNLVRNGGIWEDDDADEKADLLTYSGIGIYTFNDIDLYQSIFPTAPSNTAHTGYIIFPLAGISLYAKLNQKLQSPIQSWTLYIQAFNFASGLLGQVSVADADYIISLLLPTTTYKVRLIMAIDTGDNVKFFLPYLGLQRDNYLDINY